MSRNEQKFFESLYIRESFAVRRAAIRKYCCKSQKRHLLLLTQQWLHTGYAGSMAALLAAAAERTQFGAGYRQINRPP